MPSTPPDPYRRNEHARRAILDSAIAVIGEVGYERASIEAIAKRAGVGKATIYRWWPSKGAILLEALGDILAETVEILFPDSGDIVADLRPTMMAAVQLLGPPGDVRTAYQGLIAAAQSDPDLSRAHLEQLLEPWFAAFRQRIVHAQERGELRAGVDPQTINDMLFGAIFYRLLLHHGPLGPEQVDAALDIALHGLRCHPAPDE